MNIYDSANLGSGFTGERIALPAGKYGTSKEPGLRIVKYLGSKSSRNDAELVDHGYLVAAEAEEGTAFMHLRVKSWWLHDAVYAIAFTSEKHNAVAEVLAAGRVTQDEIDNARKVVETIAGGKVIAANTPPDMVDEATATAVKNLLTQIRIAIGEVFRLQEWKGIPRSLEFDPASFDGISFSGVVEPGFTAGTSEVKSIYGRSKSGGATVLTAATASVAFP
jgi:hypothetical protein